MSFKDVPEYHIGADSFRREHGAQQVKDGDAMVGVAVRSLSVGTYIQQIKSVVEDKIKLFFGKWQGGICVAILYSKASILKTSCGMCVMFPNHRHYGRLVV